MKLIGTSCNKSAIGSRVKVVASNESGESRVFYNTVNSGGSFGANPLLVEQGLDNFDKIEEIELLWPGQTSPQIIDDVEINTYLLITQGRSKPEVIMTNVLEFDSGKHHH